MQFTEQTERLRERKEELDRGAEKIDQLMENLEKKKDEAIERTFKGVAKHFKEVRNSRFHRNFSEINWEFANLEKILKILQVFAELVQGGVASLIMHRRDAKVRPFDTCHFDILTPVT